MRDIIDYSKLPAHMQEGMRLWIERGIEPGSFLMAVLRNDLQGAYMRADHINQERIRDFVQFLCDEAPSACHGGDEEVMGWISIGGLLGSNAELPQS